MQKYSLFAIFTLLLISPVAFQSVHATSSTDSWYPGKGLKQGDYFSYNVCWTDWHNCAPLQMNFWIKNETSDGSGWNVVFVAVDGSNTQKGIMTIGKITPDPTSFDPNIADYTGVYRSTVSWLDSFATKDTPKTFDVPAWGRTGSVGGQSVGPVDHEKVTVGAGTFDTYVLGWHKGVDNKIWIDSSVPFPVKAIVYVDVTSGVPPPDYTLELLQMGNSPTEPSFLDVSSTIHKGYSPQCDTPNMEQDSVHDSVTTDSNSMIVEYRYSPSNPHNGCPVEYRIWFEKNSDPSQTYSNTQYDIFTVDDQGKQISSIAQSKGRSSLFAPVGTDDVTTILKGTTPTSHVLIAMLGIGAEGTTPDPTLSGIVKFDIKTQDPFSGFDVSTTGQQNQTTQNNNTMTNSTMTNSTTTNSTTVIPMNNTGGNMSMPMKISVSIPKGSTDSNGITYDQKDVSIMPGTTITWTNNDDKPHTITSGSAQAGPDGKFDSGLIQPGQTFSYTFNSTGSYSYFDQPSPWLSGTVTVSTAIPEFPLGSLLIMAIVIALGVLFIRINPRLSSVKL
jgi:plastocyanin